MCLLRPAGLVESPEVDVDGLVNHGPVAGGRLSRGHGLSKEVDSRPSVVVEHVEVDREKLGAAGMAPLKDAAVASGPLSHFRNKSGGR